MNENREKNVLDLLEKRQYVSVEEVSHAFAVSDSTTRRIFVSWIISGSKAYQ